MAHKKKVIKKTDFAQPREELGMRVMEVTAEKFDPIYEVRMLKALAEREHQLNAFATLTYKHQSHDASFSAEALLETLLLLREATCEVVESVVAWRGRLVRREPVRWREPDGTLVNYLLKVIRDTEVTI